MASPAYFYDPSKACSAWHVAWSSGCLRAIARYFSLVALSRSANSLRILSLSACSLASWKRLKSSWRLLLKSSSTALICSATLFSAGLDGAGGASFLGWSAAHVRAAAPSTRTLLIRNRFMEVSFWIDHSALAHEKFIIAWSGRANKRQWRHRLCDVSRGGCSRAECAQQRSASAIFRDSSCVSRTN